MKATLIENLVGRNGDYRVDPPMTYIFPANSKGEVLDWLELPGSFRGALDHTRALEGAGYSTQ